MFVIQLKPDLQRELPRGELVLVGRDDCCNLQLDDPSASRIHCRLLARSDGVQVTDAGSRWGTFVNGERITDCEVHPGDEIQIGETTLFLAEDRGPLATTMKPGNVRGAENAEAPAEESPASTPPASENRMPIEEQIRPVRFIGNRFLRFHVQETIAPAARGVVFLAEDVRTGQEVALKLFHPSGLANEVDRSRFVRAVQTMIGKRAPHLVPLLAGGRHDGICYTVSAYIEGESAADLIRKWGIAGMLDWRRTLAIGIDIARALEYATSEQIVHRNIKPANILIRQEDGTALLNDLLLVKALNESAGAGVTKPGDIVGTLAYLSPEQVGGGPPVDHRSDLYQLGATMYALLTGRPPFDGRNAMETIQQILTADPEPPTRYQLSIPAVLEGIVLHMLQKRPADRFASASELLHDLTSAQRHLGV